jgi:MarR family 2-MHQ and catechol resistance regulon transcriptional repressor
LEPEWLASSGMACRGRDGRKAKWLTGGDAGGDRGILDMPIDDAKTIPTGVSEMAKSMLQRELKKKRPFDSPEQETALQILRTNDQLQNRLGRFFRSYGLTSSQYNVLRILRGEGKPLPSLEIAERMVQVVPAITGLIDRLEKQDLVARRRCEEDRRVVYVELTAKGEQLLAQIDEPLVALQKELLGHLTRTELGELSRLLEKARAKMQT